jgi:membrane protein DedA with SNARE-associated domain
MNGLWSQTYALAQAALQGMGAPWVIVLVLILTTFLLEDLAIAAGAALATQGTLSWEVAFAAVAGGIALGDVGLYACGLGARRVQWLRRKYIADRAPWLQDKLRSRLPSAVLLARVVPGLRLVTYTLCGFARVPVVPFVAWVLLAVSVWTVGLFWLGSALGSAIALHLGISAPLAVGLLIFILALAVPLWRPVKKLFITKAV